MQGWKKSKEVPKYSRDATEEETRALKEFYGDQPQEELENSQYPDWHPMYEAVDDGDATQEEDNLQPPLEPQKLNLHVRNFGEQEKNCDCNPPLQAKLATVQKDGPNKGRDFYSCCQGKDNGCKFFEWADGVGNRPKHNNKPFYPPRPAVVIPSGPIPKCKCPNGEDAKIAEVLKDGPNKGKKFWSCYKGKNDGCGFFSWAKDEDKRARLAPQRTIEKVRHEKNNEQDNQKMVLNLLEMNMKLQSEISESLKNVIVPVLQNLRKEVHSLGVPPPLEFAQLHKEMEPKKKHLKKKAPVVERNSE